MWWCLAIILSSQETEAGVLQVKGQPAKFSEILSQKFEKSTGGLGGSVIESLPSRHKTLGLIPSTAEKKRYKINGPLHLKSLASI